MCLQLWCKLVMRCHADANVTGKIAIFVILSHFANLSVVSVNCSVVHVCLKVISV